VVSEIIRNTDQFSVISSIGTFTFLKVLIRTKIHIFHLTTDTYIKEITDLIMITITKGFLEIQITQEIIVRRTGKYGE
jgi:hypothetical protein